MLRSVNMGIPLLGLTTVVYRQVCILTGRSGYCNVNGQTGDLCSSTLCVDALVCVVYVTMLNAAD